MIGATIRMGAGHRSLTMQGHTWDLLDLDRHATRAVGQLLSDTMGLKRPEPTEHRTGKRGGRKAPRASRPRA